MNIQQIGTLSRKYLLFSAHKIFLFPANYSPLRQEELQTLWDKYYEECHAVIYVVDSGDRERVEESKAAFDKMIKNETIRGIPLLVAANKQDLADCMGVREVKHLFENNVEVSHQYISRTLGSL